MAALLLITLIYIINEFYDYFYSLFQEPAEEGNIDWNQALADITQRVPEELNLKLREPYTSEEIIKALSEMHPTKAPGIDGFSPVFYQRFLQLIKGGVCEEILRFLNT